MAEPIDYKAVLSDLEARRAVLDNMIHGVKQILGESQTLSSNQPTDQKAQDIGELPRDAFFGLSIPDAIRKYLGMVKTPQSPRAITTALERGGFHHASKNFYTTVFTALKRQQNKTLIKIRNDWGLIDWYPGLKKSPPKNPIKTDDTKEDAASDNEKTESGDG